MHEGVSSNFFPFMPERLFFSLIIKNFVSFYNYMYILIEKNNIMGVTEHKRLISDGSWHKVAFLWLYTCLIIR